MGLYRQCLLRRKNVEQRVWIPMEFANPGKHVKIRPGSKKSGCLVGSAGAWEDGWLVIEAFGSKTQEDLDNQRSAQRELADKLKDH
jgi:hypothetical protein